MANTSSLRELVKLLGCSLVVEPFRPTALTSAEAPSEMLTASCRDSGLSEAYDSGFDPSE